MMDWRPAISQEDVSVHEEIHENPIRVPNRKSLFSKNHKFSAMKLKYVLPSCKDGKPAVSLSSEDFVDQIQKCEQLLVGSFVGQTLSLNLVKDTLWMLWKPEGKIQMSSYGYSVYIFEFEDEKDRVKAMEMTPIYIASQLFLIQPWRPFIEVELLSRSPPMIKNKHRAERRELGYVRYFHRRPILCSWLRPNEGWYMLNTDGSLSNDGAGYGAIIRGNNGVVVAAVAGSVRPSSTIVHEIQAIEAALRLAYSNHLTRVVVATDSTEAARIISDRDKAPYCTIDKTGILSEWKKPPPRYISSLMRRIEAICLQFEEIVVRHVYRETNRAADHLSRLLPRSHFVEILPSSFSEDLENIVFEDSIGTVYERSLATLGGKARSTRSFVEITSRRSLKGSLSFSIYNKSSDMARLLGDWKFDNEYLVTVIFASEKLKGIFYHVPLDIPIFCNSSSSLLPRQRRKRSRLRATDPTRSKPNRSGYNFFFSEHYASLQTSNVQEETISMKIGNLWSELTEAENRQHGFARPQPSGNANKVLGSVKFIPPENANKKDFV